MSKPRAPGTPPRFRNHRGRLRSSRGAPAQQRFQRLAKRADRAPACPRGERSVACAAGSPASRSPATRHGRREGPIRPPPPPPPVASATAEHDVCADGGGQDTDAVSGPFVPRTAGGLLPRPAGRAQDVRRQGQVLDGRGVHHGVRRRVRGVQALRPRSRGGAPLRRRDGGAQQRRGQPLSLQDGRRRVRHVHQARRRRRRPGARDGQASRRGRRWAPRAAATPTSGAGSTSSS